MSTEWLNGVDFVMFEQVLLIMDEELLREAETSFFQPLIRVEPPTLFDPYASEQELET